jgi:ATP-dependent RNA helicase DeaD
MITDETHPFSSFGLSETMLAAIARKGWTAPSFIQGIALPRLLASEGHLIVKARTGTGKTAAFGIPLIEKLAGAGHAPRALILTPTRELALQVSREIISLVSGHYPRVAAVYGGASIRSQIMDLRRGAEIVVGTPGRVIDLHDRKSLDFSAVDWFILDEADEMLDMGFLEDVEKILESVKTARLGRSAPEPSGTESAADLPPLRIALFSATMPEPILKVVRTHIGAVDIIEDSAPDDEKPLLDQYCMIVRREDKLEALRRVIDGADDFYGLIFCATKVETDELARRLVEAGYPAEAMHGDLSQEVRERTLRRFRLHRAVEGGGPAILVATDVAARGIDIEKLTHVINWDLPGDRETYVHRVGRTGRAGRRGIAVSFALPSQRGRISQLSRMMEHNLGNPIRWLKVPPVKAVMKAVRRRIAAAVIAALPEQALADETSFPADANNELANAAVIPVNENAPLADENNAPANEAANTVSPFLAKVCRQLIERLGAERAVEALVTLKFGTLLDPARYGPVTEFSEEDFHEPPRGRFRQGQFDGGRRREGFRRHEGGGHGRHESKGGGGWDRGDTGRKHRHEGAPPQRGGRGKEGQGLFGDQRSFFSEEKQGKQRRPFEEGGGEKRKGRRRDFSHKSRQLAMI